jgi:hypothetical protein
MSEGRVTAALKRAVAERAGSCCEYCRSQARLATHPFSVEHIIPKIRGGAATLDNLALACQGCNNHKYDKTTGRDPTSGQVVQLYHPRQHRWLEHFAWSPEFVLIMGLTPIGRTTVEALQLNRAGVVNLRRVLYAMGDHPPPDPEG